MTPLTDIHTHSDHSDRIYVKNIRLGTDEIPSDKGPFSLGIHPWDAALLHPDIDKYLRIIQNSDNVLVGEIGLDKICGVDWGLQMEVFEAQAAVAQRPIIIHSVRAHREVLEVLKRRTLQPAIFHAFVGSPEQAAEIVRQGGYLSFGFGSLRSTKTLRALQYCPSERLLLESDTTPLPIAKLYAQVAAIRGVSMEELIETTYKNFKQITE